jgi:hypothetical protein
VVYISRGLVRFAIILSTRIVLPHRFLRALLACALATSSLVSVKASEIEWIRQFGGAGPAFDLAHAVHGDGDGNVYVAGETQGILAGQTSAGDTDAFLRKYDVGANEVWTRQFGTSSEDRAHAVVFEGSALYVAGFTDGTLPGQTSAGGGDAFVRKYDANGNEVWTRQFGTAGLETVDALATDISGLYVAGFTTGTLSGRADAFIRKYDADGNEVWTRQFGTSVADVLAMGVVVDGSGIYVVGRADYALAGQPNGGNGDAFVRKYDHNGNETWTRQFGTSQFDEANGVGVDSSGVYVAGLTVSSLPGQMSAGSRDAFVRKYDTSGNEVWTRQFGGPSDDRANGVAVDSSGVYVAGQIQTSSGGDGDAILRKYDASGNEAWTRQFGSPRFTTRAVGAAVDTAGVYVTGFTTGTLPGQTSGGNSDPFVRTYDVSGNEVWTRQFAGAGPASDFAQAVDSDGNLYVVGKTFGSMPGHTNAGDTLSPEAGADAFVRKYDAIGNEVWTRQFGTSASDQANGVAADFSGVYVVGQTAGTLPGQANAGGVDAFVRKYDGDGNEVWTRQFGAFSSDAAVGVAVDSSGVYVAGQIVAPTTDEFGRGNFEAFLRKYDASGSEAWRRQFGTSGFDRADAVAVNASGAYVAGRTAGTFPGQTSAGSTDAFVRKYDSSGIDAWTRQFGTSSDDLAFGIAVDASGIFVVGRTGATLPGQTSAGAADAFVRTYDANGNEEWTRQFGSSGFDQAIGVSADVSGVFVVGAVNGTLPGETSAGSSDAFVRTYDASGNATWTRQFGTSGSDQGSGVSVDSSGAAAYVVGFTSGTFPGQISAGGTDAFVSKLSWNVAPSIVSIDAPFEPVRVGTEITASGMFSDLNILDTHTAVWDWDDGSTSPGAVVDSGGSGTVSGAHTYTSAGVYTLTLTVTDNRDMSDSATFEYVVVYHPEGGFVTGAGSFDSPAGAYAANPALTGKARFGLVSKYQTGATTPTGETHFDFRVADFSFRSTEYQWLVIAGPKAQYKGSGTINGSGNYGFLLTVTDGEVNGGGGQDKFRIKIWNKATGTVIYDNQAGDVDGADAATVISGSIVIHK